MEIAGVEVKLYNMFLESIRGISIPRFPGPSSVGKNVHKVLYEPYSYKKVQINIPDFVARIISSLALELFYHTNDVLLHSIKL